MDRFSNRAAQLRIIIGDWANAMLSGQPGINHALWALDLVDELEDEYEAECEAHELTGKVLDEVLRERV